MGRTLKNITLFLLAGMLLMCGFSIGLADTYPGEEVTVTLTLYNTNAAYVRVRVSYDTSVFVLVGYSSDIFYTGPNGILVYDDGKVMPSGKIGTVTLRVKENAVPGTYAVSGYLAECYDIDERDAIASVSDSYVTVASKACSHPSTKVLPGTAATCTSEGLTDGEQCTVCGEILTAQMSIAPLGHKYAIIERTNIEPTCTLSGKDIAVFQCTRCGVSYIVDGEETPALGHNYVLSDSINIEPTCTQSGIKEDKYQCTRCGDSYTADSEVFQALGHDYVLLSAYAPPTCTEQGQFTVYQCTRCGDTYTEEAPDESMAAIGSHTYRIAENTATCIKSGTITFVCVRCGDTLSSTMKLDHHTIEIPGKEPTCTEAGYSSEIQCVRCGLVLQQSETLPALNHHFIRIFDNETSTYTCSRCGLSLYDSSDGVLHQNQSDANNIDLAEDEKPLPVLDEKESFLDYGFMLSKDFIQESIRQGLVKIEFLFEGGTLIIHLDAIQQELFQDLSDTIIDAYAFTLDIKNQEYQIAIKAISNGTALAETVLNGTEFGCILLQKDL